VNSNLEQKQQVAKEAFVVMARLGVDPSPENYQLFHGYAVQRDLGLKRAVDSMIALGSEFTPEILDQLRDNHLGAKLGVAVSDLGASLNSTLSDVLARIAQAERDAVAYNRTLTKASGELDGVDSPEHLTNLVGSLLTATRVMENRTKNLEAELQRSSQEVDDLKAKLDDVRMESLTDQLTGIRNRKAFDDDLESSTARARKTGESLCLFMCDIDRFKMFNDTWGHQTGDQVLRLVANCLSENVKGRDTAARYGGEEFAVILPQTALTDAVSLANAIRLRVESKKLLKKSTGDVLGVITISIGVAQFAPDDTVESFVQRADSCLYAAKHNGRNLVMAQTDMPATRAA
jgi:diguanylate cyclase